MTEIVTVSSKYQIVIPKAVRQALQIQPGDELVVDLAPTGDLRLRPRPRSYTSALRGLHREIWRDTDPVAYVRREREAWQER